MDGWIEFIVFFSFVGLGILIDARKKRSRSASQDQEVEQAKGSESVLAGRTARITGKRPNQQKAASHQPSPSIRTATIPDAPVTPGSEKEHEELVEEVRKGIIWSEILTRKY